MATTTNYGWTTPDDTALVKDGAAAIRTLGSSVDTTTKNLNPETTLGDISYRSSTSNTNTRLGIGSTGQVLTVAAGVPSWAAPAGGTFSGVSLNDTSASQTISNTTDTAVTWDSEIFDTDSFHSTSSNTSRITIPAGKGGKYEIKATVMWGGNATGGRYLKLYKNGSAITWNISPGSGTDDLTMTICYCLDLAVADYIELYVFQNSGGNRLLYKDDTLMYANFSAIYLGA